MKNGSNSAAKSFQTHSHKSLLNEHAMIQQRLALVKIKRKQSLSKKPIKRLIKRLELISTTKEPS